VVLAAVAVLTLSCASETDPAVASPRGVEVRPASADVALGATVPFTANVSVTWSIQEGDPGGSITASGTYTAPASTGQFHVVATSVADPGVSGTAVVTVTPAPTVQVAIAPSAPSVAAGGTVTFQATVTGTADTSVVWSVRETTACGAVSSSGVYTAPTSATTCHVVATSVADATKSATATVTVTAPSGSLASNLATLSGKSIYFGHQSVGGNLMDGVRALLATNSGPEPTVINSSSAAEMGPGKWAEAYNGSNYDPEAKISDFQTTIVTNGSGASLDLAFMKFCWVDFDDYWYWVPYPDGAGATVQSVFAKYQAMVAAVHQAYPTLKLVHFTVPLYADDVVQNERRESYNALVRSTYGGVEPVFDLALRESTNPSGNRVIGTHGPRLYAGYTSDGGHLDANVSQGRDRFAADLIALLAGL
jgi:hypothetical protein